MKIFNPQWLPVKMSNGKLTINVDFLNDKFIISQSTGETFQWSFVEFARYVAKNKLQWAELGLAGFSKPAIHLYDAVCNWLEGQDGVVLYSVQLDRVVIWKKGKCYLEGECKDTLPLGQYVIHPRSEESSILIQMKEMEQKKFSWGNAVTGCLVGLVAGCALMLQWMKPNY